MATLPTLHSEAKPPVYDEKDAAKEPRHSDSFSDEKVPPTDALGLGEEVEEVYADVRLIDLGEDGKERPIGMFYYSFSRS
jgi:hypothetical protein